MAKFLNSDLIARVMELCRDDYDLLYRCSLVDWEFNQAASRMLYAHVVISPMFKPVLDLKDTGSIPLGWCLGIDGSNGAEKLELFIRDSI
ncbi:hypothetical protein NLJ89_g2069 [Agrocybe chaxingu]|uniref:Uncharacterized protein n=1 Tax=Agrocybe chaxingu TaxID=84603 RepID=A0A9W8K536_9AGAR|nr:hypothetical protein NLJ89_g2069 [Agrocybe chaxingu]